jgi:hypothetical protein
MRMKDTDQAQKQPQATEEAIIHHPKTNAQKAQKLPTPPPVIQCRRISTYPDFYWGNQLYLLWGKKQNLRLLTTNSGALR